MTQSENETFHQEVSEWLGSLGYSLWGGGWDLTDPKEVGPATDWFVAQCKLFEAWLVSTGKIEAVDAPELGDAGVQPSDQPYPTPASDPGLAESGHWSDGFRFVDGEI